MARKGDFAILEPQAKRLYAEGRTLREIAEILDVSETTLGNWKRNSKFPDRDLDEWDRGREQRRSNIQRLRDLFEREMAAAEVAPAGSISPQQIDALSKLSSMVQRWERLEREAIEQAQAENAAQVIDKPALFLETIEWIAGKLKDTDPAGLKVLADNFDGLVLQYKLENQ